MGRLQRRDSLPIPIRSLSGVLNRYTVPLFCASIMLPAKPAVQHRSVGGMHFATS
jgi:hypothetical protein